MNYPGDINIIEILMKNCLYWNDGSSYNETKYFLYKLHNNNIYLYDNKVFMPYVMTPS